MKLNIMRALKGKLPTRVSQTNNYKYNFIPGMPLLTKRLRDFGKPLNEGLLVVKTEKEYKHFKVLRSYKAYLGDREIGEFYVKKSGIVFWRTAIGMVQREYTGTLPSSETGTVTTNGFFLLDGLRILMERKGIDPARVSESLKNFARRRKEGLKTVSE